VAAIEKLIGKEIPRMTIDGIGPAELEFDEGKRRRRRAPKSDEPRGESRKRREAPAREAATAEAKPKRHRSAEPKPPRDEAPKPLRNEAPKPRRDEAPKPRRDETPKRRRDEPRRRAASSEVVRMSPEGMDGNVTRLPTTEHGRKHDRDDQDDKRVVGFGDHLPAFLARPVRVAGGRR
jgi:hypothetical protein